MASTSRETKKIEYLRDLPLLGYTSSLYSGVDLKNVYIICAQHLVSTSYALFNALLGLGLAPSNLSVIGKCYSSDPRAVEEMERLGIDVCPSNLCFDSHTSFDEQYRANIKNFVLTRASRLNNNQFHKIIVLDDGGELLSEVSSRTENSSKAIGIEQTSSGYHKIKRKRLNFSVINVARSTAKLGHESPIIAKLVLDSLVQNLEDISLKPGRALVVGNGPVGSHIYKALKSTHETLIFDKIPSKSHLSLEDFQKSLGKFDLIIGCTGASVLRSKEFNLLKKQAVLVSASSSDREFSAEELRKKISPVHDCHSHLQVEDKWLINCGFPINFSSNFRAIDPDVLQLTRSLLLAAILQASDRPSTTGGRFIPLDLGLQRSILRKYYSLFPEEQLQEKLALAI